MNNSEKISKVQNRSEKIEYKGNYKNLQVYGNTFKGMRYSHYEQDPYNLNQNALYKRVMFGLSVYNQKEIKSMHVAKRARIERVHKRAQEELNLWKQEKVIEMTNKILSLFGNSPMAKNLIEEFSDVDNKIKNTFTFKELNINKDEIIQRLIYVGILPKHFYNLE